MPCPALRNFKVRQRKAIKDSTRQETCRGVVARLADERGDAMAVRFFGGIGPEQLSAAGAGSVPDRAPDLVFGATEPAGGAGNALQPRLPAESGTPNKAGKELYTGGRRQ